MTTASAVCSAESLAECSVECSASKPVSITARLAPVSAGRAAINEGAHNQFAHRWKLCVSLETNIALPSSGHRTVENRPAVRGSGSLGFPFRWFNLRSHTSSFACGFIFRYLICWAIVTAPNCHLPLTDRQRLSLPEDACQSVDWNKL